MNSIIKSLSEFVEQIVKLNRNRKINIEENEILFFRGQNDKDYQLIPALARYPSNYSNVTLIEYERNLIESAKRRYPSVFGNCQTPLDLLALLQHYGMPTRLLDVTQNPLVALYFACKGGKNDGEVFAFKDNQRDMTTYPIINAIADSYRFVKSNSNLDSFYSNALEQPYFSEQYSMLQSLYPPNSNGLHGNSNGAKWIQQCCKEPLFVYAQELCQRQKAQQGSFILFHNRINSYNTSSIYFEQMAIDPIDKDADCIIKRFTIQEKDKKDLLKQLAMVGITEASLFPDSIDKGCAEIAESQRAQLTV